ncbi:hypothetical protein BU16DRAFT_536802 [Lophium mytilinum]|uniref:Uncharacterized protein n=1 Tax=Lophium mytilinum TaxID=390894 RepID=A0A6A6R383_9PEZI|nr:hypothetical protein BU16DRAFT_536802 [Lophium mytilinum]
MATFNVEVTRHRKQAHDKLDGFLAETAGKYVPLEQHAALQRRVAHLETENASLETKVKKLQDNSPDKLSVEAKFEKFEEILEEVLTKFLAEKTSIDTRVKKLEGRFETSNTTIEELQSEIHGHDESGDHIDGIKERLRQASRWIKRFDRDTEVLRGADDTFVHISDSLGKIDGVRTDLDRLKTSVNGLDTRFSDLERRERKRAAPGGKNAEESEGPPTPKRPRLEFPVRLRTTDTELKPFSALEEQDPATAERLVAAMAALVTRDKVFRGSRSAHTDWCVRSHGSGRGPVWVDDELDDEGDPMRSCSVCAKKGLPCLMIRPTESGEVELVLLPWKRHATEGEWTKHSYWLSPGKPVLTV